VLQLRVYGQGGSMTAAAQRLKLLPGVRHVTTIRGAEDQPSLLSADLRAEAADPALAMLRGLGIPAENVELLRLDAIAAADTDPEPAALVYADLLGQARINARQAGRYLVFMAAAGVIAAFGVIENDQVLIVGAMAVAPDLLPITAAGTGIVLRRWGLLRRALLTVVVGLGVAALVAAAASALLDAFDLLPSDFALTETGIAAQQHVSAETISVAFAAGVVGMLALETRASAAVGVAISVTTIPASAFLGVALGVGELDKATSALGVLLANVLMMLVGGSITLVGQQRIARSRTVGRERERAPYI
jgi:uncharacterized hydrophobic protein (TIGR00271 family)